jgi:Adenylate and Guanylate cyclase catalytic domain
MFHFCDFILKLPNSPFFLCFSIQHIPTVVHFLKNKKGDICGFTAWSSTREPTQVFILLQTVYLAFDALAKRRNVFKVETIGDSYVAVTGLPEPQEDHAIIMARFAADCLHTMIMIARDLETKLGPDTGELCMRFGLNSGPGKSMIEPYQPESI